VHVAELSHADGWSLHPVTDASTSAAAAAAAAAETISVASVTPHQFVTTDQSPTATSD